MGEGTTPFRGPAAPVFVVSCAAVVPERPAGCALPGGTRSSSRGRAVTWRYAARGTTGVERRATLGFWDFLLDRREILLFHAYQHGLLVLQCVLVAAVLAVIVAALVYRSETAVNAATATSAIGLTIPSFAMLGLLIPLVGLGVAPTVIALVFYATLPILRNAVVGLVGVDRAVVESARGMGLSRLHVLLRIELPLAWPVILAGIRISTQMIMGIAAIAAYVLGPGLGDLIFTGLSSPGSANAIWMVLSGTLGVLVLALVFDALLVLAGRLTISRGIRA